MASTSCSYVANYRYSWKGHSRYSSGAPTIINGHCSSNIWIENGTSYESRNLYCDNNQVFVNLFIGSECEGQPAVTGIPITSDEQSPNVGNFSYSCNDEECSNYFLFRVYNSSFVNYDGSQPPTECIAPGLDVFSDVFEWKALINVCYSVEDGNSEINTCNATGGYQWHHEGSNCDDNEPELVQFAPAEGCSIKLGFNGTDDAIYPYGKLTFCGDDMEQDPAADPTVDPTVDSTVDPLTEHPTTDPTKRPSISTAIEITIIRISMLVNATKLSFHDIEPTVNKSIDDFFENVNVKARYNYSVEQDIITFDILLINSNENINLTRFKIDMQTDLDNEYGEGTVVIVNIYIVDEDKPKSSDNSLFIVMVIICILLIMILVVSVLICFKFIKNKSKPRTSNYEDTPSTNIEDEMKKHVDESQTFPSLPKSPTLPKAVSINPPALAEQDSLNVEGVKREENDNDDMYDNDITVHTPMDNDCDNNTRNDDVDRLNRIWIELQNNHQRQESNLSDAMYENPEQIKGDIMYTVKTEGEPFENGSNSNTATKRVGDV